MAPRRVLHYVDSDLFGGSEEAALHLIGALDRTRWEPLLLHHPEPGLGRLVDGAKALGIRTVAAPRVERHRRLAGVLRLRRAIEAEQPDVFHAHLSWPLACKYGVIAARLAGVRAIVGTAQLYVQPRGSWSARLVLPLFRRIIAVSDEVGRRYARELRVPPERLAVVRNGIRVPGGARPPDAELRAALVAGRPRYVVLTPARLHPQKGHEYLLAAAREVPDATFVLAGDGPLRAELEDRARELGIADRCVFLGHRSDVPALLGAADLFVLPSLYEGLPVSVLEAMSASRPVIATAIGGTDEAVAHGQTGWLVPPGDPSALASAIRRLQTDPALARRLADAGRERVERDFSSDATARRVMQIYDDVAGAAATRDPSSEDDAEAKLNPRLRRADWRFLLPAPRPRRVLCRADGALAEAVAAVALEVVGADPGGGCDLVVGEDPGPDALADLYAALEPGGTCYTEWRPAVGGPRRVARALEAAGFTDVTCYRSLPAGAPLYWVPCDSSGAEAYVRARMRLRGGRVRRLVTHLRERTRDLASGRIGGRLCAVARRPAGGHPHHADPSAWLRDHWAAWGLGAAPRRLSMLLLTGGARTVSKVVLLAFDEPDPRPLVAVKGPRVPAAAAALRREAAALEALAARRPGGVPGVPRLLFQREVDGVPLVGETAIAGRPLESLLTPASLRPWSIKVADWLATLASGAPVRPPAHWREALVEPVLSRFSERFGHVVDPGLLRESEGIARAIGALPGVPEQRDFGPWNLLVAPAGGLAVLDWESADVEGLPALDLLYYLAYASFGVDRAYDRERRIASYQRSLDPTTRTGAVRRDCLARYLEALGLDAACLAPLRVLVWLIHAQSDFAHAAADAGGAPPPAMLARTLFVGLWAEEVRHLGRG